MIGDKANVDLNFNNVVVSIYLSIYSPGQKYKSTLKTEEKYISYNIFWIIKTRYMKDRVKRHLNLKLEEISIYFYMNISIHAKF